MITRQRTLADVESALSSALQEKTYAMLDIGRLLNEAKDLVGNMVNGSLGCGDTRR